jgi:hypothetical protein
MSKRETNSTHRFHSQVCDSHSLWVSEWMNEITRGVNLFVICCNVKGGAVPQVTTVSSSLMTHFSVAVCISHSNILCIITSYDSITQSLNAFLLFFSCCTFCRWKLVWVTEERRYSFTSKSNLNFAWYLISMLILSSYNARTICCLVCVALHGGDSDSTGAIAAAWFGAFYGFKYFFNLIQHHSCFLYLIRWERLFVAEEYQRTIINSWSIVRGCNDSAKSSSNSINDTLHSHFKINKQFVGSLFQV